MTNQDSVSKPQTTQQDTVETIPEADGESGDKLAPSKRISNRAAKREFEKLIQHTVYVLVACGILMWSVFNLSYNLLLYRANQESDLAWSVTLITVAITCVVPLLIGLYMLFKSFRKSEDSPTQDRGKQA